MLTFFPLLVFLAFVSSTHYRYASYIDTMTGWYDTLVLTAWGVPGYTTSNDYNTLYLSFYESDGKPADALYPWVDPTKYFSAALMQQITNMSNPSDQDFRNALLNIYHSNGITLMASCFGGTDYPTNLDPVTLGNNIAEFIKNYTLDGVDLDWEDSASFDSGDGKGENWLISITKTLRSSLGSNYIITHAPQAPYFMGKSKYPAGAYLTVHQEVGDLIDWYNIQFYNQGSSSYDTYYTMFVASNGWATNTAVYQMIQGTNDMNVKIPSEMIIVGKPVNNGDASNGYVSASTLASIFDNATQSTQSIGWNTGFMDWQFSSDQNENYNFVNTIVPSFHH